MHASVIGLPFRLTTRPDTVLTAPGTSTASTWPTTWLAATFTTCAVAAVG